MAAGGPGLPNGPPAPGKETPWLETGRLARPPQHGRRDRDAERLGGLTRLRALANLHHLRGEKYVARASEIELERRRKRALTHKLMDHLFYSLNGLL